jgi:hypothetical protein
MITRDEVDHKKLTNDNAILMKVVDLALPMYAGSHVGDRLWSPDERITVTNTLERGVGRRPLSHSTTPQAIRERVDKSIASKHPLKLIATLINLGLIDDL